MKVFTVHRRETGSRPDGAAVRGDDLALVKEGFAWLAALGGPLWAFVHGMWSWTAVTLSAWVAYGALLEAVPMGAVAQAAILAALSVLIGAHANDARRRSLLARGYRMVAVVSARDIDGALLRYLDGAASAYRAAP